MRTRPYAKSKTLPAIPAIPAIPADSSDKDVKPRRRSTSAQRSVHRDYFVYQDQSTAAPALHLRSKTLPHIPIRDLPLWQPRSHVDGGDTPQTPTHITVTDDSTPTDRVPDTLPTIPGSSASSASSPNPLVRTEDTTSAQVTPRRSVSTTVAPLRSSTRRSIDQRQQHTSSELGDRPESYHSPRRAASEHRTRRHSGTTKPPQAALSVGHPNPESQQDDPLQEYRYWDLPQTPPPPELPEKEAYGRYRVVNPDSPLPYVSEPDQQVGIKDDTHREGQHTTTPINDDKNSVADHPEPAIKEKTLETQEPSTVTQYMNMLLALDEIPRIHNLAASFFTWILLAGFVLFPGTFASLRNNAAAKDAVDLINHIPLFVIAFLCCGIGAAGMGYFWWRWMNNYVWLVNKIFLPGLLNGFTGVISTLASVYGAQNGEFSSASKTTIIVTTSTTFICGVLTSYYLLWKIRRMKLEHDNLIGKQSAGKHGEGLIHKSISLV
ncbi:hypothetical protein APHAL10511_000205 [Amanita phalloides]|nr:hypothetical protein APHAL10511_000205 [Amanita phalloides]